MSSADSIFDSVCPSDLGLPPKFDRYRLHQRDALSWLDSCSQSIDAMLLPTGSGKTAVGVSYAKWLGVKAVYLVATKALQSQVMSDFASIGMVDIRGRANYTCPNHGDCDKGADAECSLARSSGCPYTCAVERAKDSDLVCTNYSYWLAARKNNSQALERDCRPVELLICDEGHNIEQQLTSFAGVKIYQRELAYSTIDIDKSGLMNDEESLVWYDWAARVVARCKHTKGAVEKLDPNGYRRDDRWIDADDLEQRVNKILRMNGNWVWQFDDRGHCEFLPVRLGGYIRALFSGVPRALIMSASLSEFSLRLFLKDEPYDYRAWPQVFNPAGAPVYHIPVTKLSWRSTDEDYQAIINRMDDVIDRRSDRKGIIHTVSYARSKRILSGSRHRGKFIWNDTASGLSDCLERFRTGDPGCLLVTPSVEEGFDFPGAACEHQHIVKFPFPNETQKVVAERCKQIPGYRLHYAATKFAQICGRARRYELDRCENFIYDNAVKQLTGAEGRSYLPPGFKIFTVTTAPPPPPRI